MFFRKHILVGAAILAMGSSAQAVVLLSDDFNGESLGLNYTGFSNWSVTDGSVDLIGQPTFFNLLPSGFGRYVDLAGTTRQAGELSSNTVFGPGTYTLSFTLAGSQRGTVEQGSVMLGDFTQSFTLGSSDITTQAFTFTTSVAGSLVFKQGGPDDNIGLLLDNVELANAIPEPSTWAMMLIGFAGLGYAARRRIQAQAETSAS